MSSTSTPPRSKRGPTVANNIGRKTAASSTSQPLAAAAMRRTAISSARPFMAPDGSTRSHQMVAAQTKLSGGSSIGRSEGQPLGRGMRQPFVGPGDAQFRVPQKRPPATDPVASAVDGLGAPPAIRTRVNNRFDGGRVLSGVAASHSEHPTPYVRPHSPPRAGGAGLARTTSTGVRVSLIGVNGIQPSASVHSRVDTVAIEEVVETPPDHTWLSRQSSSPPDPEDDDGDDQQDTFASVTGDKELHSRFFQRKDTIEPHGQVEELDDNDDDDGSEHADGDRTTPPMPRDSHGHAAHTRQPHRPCPIRVSHRSSQMPPPAPPSANSRSGDEAQAQRASYLDQIADAVLDGRRAEIIQKEVERWSNVAYDDVEAWKTGGEEFARQFQNLNQSIIDYADGAARNFGALYAGVERYEAELQRTGDKLDGYRQSLARWGTDIVSGGGPSDAAAARDAVGT